MSIQRYTSNFSLMKSCVGAFVKYSDVEHELIRLNQLIEFYQKTDEKSIKSIAKEDCSYIVRYNDYSDNGKEQSFTIDASYNELEKILLDLSNQSTIADVKVYATVRMNVYKQVKFTVNLPE